MFRNLNERARINAIKRHQQLSALEGQRIAASAVRGLPQNIGAGISGLYEQHRQNQGALQSMSRGINDALQLNSGNLNDETHEIALEMAMRGERPAPLPRQSLKTASVMPMPSNTRRVAPAPATGVAASPPRGWGNWARGLFSRRARVVPTGGPAGPPPRKLFNKFFTRRVAPINHLTVMDKISELTDKLLSVHEKIETVRGTEAIRERKGVKPLITTAELKRMQSEYDLIYKKLDELIELSNQMMNISNNNRSKNQAVLDAKLNTIINQIEARTAVIIKELDKKEGGRRITRKRR